MLGSVIVSCIKPWRNSFPCHRMCCGPDTLLWFALSVFRVADMIGIVGHVSFLPQKKKKKNLGPSHLALQGQGGRQSAASQLQAHHAAQHGLQARSPCHRQQTGGAAQPCGGQHTDWLLAAAVDRRQHLSPSGDHRLPPVQPAARSPPLPGLRKGLRQAGQTLDGAVHGSSGVRSRSAAMGQPPACGHHSQGSLQRLAHSTLPSPVGGLPGQPPITPAVRPGGPAHGRARTPASRAAGTTCPQHAPGSASALHALPRRRHHHPCSLTTRQSQAYPASVGGPSPHVSPRRHPRGVALLEGWSSGQDSILGLIRCGGTGLPQASGLFVSLPFGRAIARLVPSVCGTLPPREGGLHARFSPACRSFLCPGLSFTVVVHAFVPIHRPGSSTLFGLAVRFPHVGLKSSHGGGAPRIFPLPMSSRTHDLIHCATASAPNSASFITCPS